MGEETKKIGQPAPCFAFQKTMQMRGVNEFTRCACTDSQLSEPPPDFDSEALFSRKVGGFSQAKTAERASG